MGEQSENWTTLWQPTTAASPAWHPDPTGRHDHRWFNGSEWTADVADDGRRGFDPVLVAAPSHPERPGRAAALTSLTLGVSAVAISWMPFVVVLGVAAAMSAIVLGIVAVDRTRQGRQAGRGIAVAGIACGAGALMLSGVGMASSRELLADLRATRDPGAHSVEIATCTVDSEGRATAAGEITNQGDRARSYAITITFGDSVREFADRTVTVAALASGATERFVATTSAGGTPTADLTCRVEGVSTPTLSAAGP